MTTQSAFYSEKAEALAALSAAGLTASPSFRLPSVLTFDGPVHLSDLAVKGAFEVGAYTYLGPGCDIRSGSIGRFCSIARRVVMAQAEHPTDHVSTHPIVFNPNSAFRTDPYFSAIARRRPVTLPATVSIGHDVWIGEGVFVRAGVSIGTGAIIAARAVVVKDVPPYAIVGGTPAKVIRFRFSDSVIERLLNSEWWRLDLRGVEHLLADPEAFLNHIETDRPNVLPFTRTRCALTPSRQYEITQSPVDE